MPESREISSSTVEISDSQVQQIQLVLSNGETIPVTIVQDGNPLSVSLSATGDSLPVYGTVSLSPDSINELKSVQTATDLSLLNACSIACLFGIYACFGALCVFHLIDSMKVGR